MNEEVKQLFEQFSSVVSGLEDKLNKILDAYSEAEADYNDSMELSDWETNHGEKLHKYDAQLKALNGDDFDVIKAARDEYKADFADSDEDEFVDKLIEHIEESLSNLKDALAEGDVAEAAHIAEDVTEQTETVAETVDEQAHDQVNAEDAETNEPVTEEVTESSETEEVPEEVTEEVPETDVEEGDEADAFEKELLAEAEKAKKQYGQD